MKFEDLAGKDVVIWGTGREGRAAQRELAIRGIHAEFVITGGGSPPADLEHATVTGAAASDRLIAADAVVKSPGIPRTSPEFSRLVSSATAVTSLMDLWLSENYENVIAVTGTKGKSTTSALIHHILSALNIDATLSGNIGVPVSSESEQSDRVTVAEVSSYQAADLTVSPRIAVVTSLYPEHLPWHGGFEKYAADKLNLVRHSPEVVIVSDSEDELGRRVRRSLTSLTRMVTPVERGISVSHDSLTWENAGALHRHEMKLRGGHNLANVTLALTAVDAFTELSDAQKVQALEAVSTFMPLRHRLEIVPSRDGRIWVDDGLATAPEAVVAALETYADMRVTLIVGGADRGLAFDPLIDYLASLPKERSVRVVAVGPAGERLSADAASRLPVLHLASKFAEALDLARQLSDSGEIILLSPGAPSFDEFTDFSERSEVFRMAAQNSLQE